MMKKNKNYWQKRAEAVAGRQFKKTDDYVTDIVKEYEKANITIQRDVITFYERFAANNEISLHEAKKLLNTKELKEFHWTVEEYIKKGKENAIDQRWMKELENASIKVRVSRLEALQTQMQQQIETLTTNQQKGMTNLLSDIYEDTYYRNIYEVHKGLGIGVNFAKLDENTIEKVLSHQWLEGNFSSRIWDNRNKLINELRTNLTQSFIRGDPIEKAARILVKRMNVSKNRATTLINTESSYITNKATIDSYKNSGVVKQYEILATLDLRTSPTCRSMDGKIFNVSEMQPGVNAPPFHPNCRTTTIAYFPDVVDAKRIARDGKGKNYYVDGNMNYKTWYKEYVKSNPEEIIGEKKIKNKAGDKKQYLKYKEILGKEIPKSFDKFRELKYNNSEEWKKVKAKYRKLNAYNKIIANESKITEDLQEISKITDTKLVGLEYRLKTKGSYLRKVNTDSGGSLNSEIIDNTIENTNDIIRYTYQAKNDKLVDKYFAVNQKLFEKSYELIKVKNTWLVKSNPYKGINCNYKSPSGQKFEIQYHTPESFELKNGEMHKLYEKWRLIKDKSSVEAVELAKEMSKLSSTLKIPDKIDKVR